MLKKTVMTLQQAQQRLAKENAKSGETPAQPWLVVSACLAGEKCRYNGGDRLDPAVKALVEQGHAVAMCPEREGGLPTPRQPAHLEGGLGFDVVAGLARVLTRTPPGVTAQDVTRNFRDGAWKTMAKAREINAQAAILKDGSPSCGVHRVTLEGTEVEGRGATAALLAHNGVAVFSEEDWAGENRTHDASVG